MWIHLAPAMNRCVKWHHLTAYFSERFLIGSHRWNIPIVIYVHYRESQPSQQTTKSQSQPKSQQLKTFIRNIAIQPSPILGKKPVIVTTTASSVHTAPKKKEESSSAAARKACKNIPAGDRVMDTGATGGCLHDDVRVKCDATPTASPRHVPQPRNKDSKVWGEITNNNIKLGIYIAPHQRSCSWCFTLNIHK